MATIENYVNLISSSDYVEISKKFPAFLCASSSGKKISAYSHPIFKTGYYFTRNPFPGTADEIKCVYYLGNISRSLSNSNNSGLRVSLQTIYNPESKLVKTCKKVSKTATIWNDAKSFSITSVAPIVIFGRQQYIWLNKKECENGKEPTMRLVSLDLVAKANAFDKKGKTNDYGSDAVKSLRQQCEEEALGKGCENLSGEERSMLVKVRLTEKDKYENANPIFYKEMAKEPERII